MYRYTHALVRGIASTLEHGLSSASLKIDMELARVQHQNYVDLLKTLVHVIEVS
jgi:N-dimethylarginine dimethylaminohydrolase